jgi:hypothetical protein
MVNIKNFIHDIEEHHPLSIKYKDYWKKIKRRCIEGYWFEGKWMPGPLYFYINAGRILMHVNGAKTKSVGRPHLRDVEWEKAYVYMEAKGFSGFELDNEYTCSRWVKMVEEDNSLLSSFIKRKKITKTEFVNGDMKTLKKYTPLRAYIRKEHSKNLGKALFKNTASNVCDLETRRIGKSMFASNGMINHNFLFDAATDYDVYLQAIKDKQPLSSETLVGAIDAKYTKDLLSKSQLGLDNLPGSVVINGIYYPSPLSKQYRGTFAAGKYVEAAYDIKLNGGWVTRGSRSKIHNRSFADNPLAGNGTGPNLVVLEEMGFINNLIAILGAMKDATYEGADKFGVIWMTGTGGQGDAAAISEAKEVFFNPDAFDCLSFDDIWEESSSIGYFVPYQMRLDEYRDGNGIIDQEAAMVDILKKRENIANSKNKKAMFDEMQNNPIAPSEAFLISSNSILPTAELKLHRNQLRSKTSSTSQCGELTWVSKEKGSALSWNSNNTFVPCHYGIKNDDDTTGCIEIWQHPQQQAGAIPYGLYVAGTDPYDQDEASSSSSLGSTFILNTLTNKIVAEYTARPKLAKMYYENVRKLLIYYGCKDMYENERNGMKMYFEQKNSLHLLSKTPDILKATEKSKVNRQYGIHMTTAIKKELMLMLRDWLLEEREDGTLNLHSIDSIPLLDELINYNDTDNFDRFISICLTLLHKNQNFKIKVEEVTKETVLDSFISRATHGRFFKQQ